METKHEAATIHDTYPRDGLTPLLGSDGASSIVDAAEDDLKTDHGGNSGTHLTRNVVWRAVSPRATS